MTSKHIRPDRLGRIAAGEPPSPTDARHLEGCRRCAPELAAYRDVLRQLRQARQVTPPDEVLERACHLVRAAIPATAMPARLVTTRTPGEALDAPAGLRAAVPASRQWLFAAGPIDVDIQAFAESPREVLLLGQVIAANDQPAPGLPVHLRHDGQPQLTLTGAHGEFALGPVRGSSAEILVETDASLHRLTLDLSPEGQRGE